MNRIPSLILAALTLSAAGCPVPQYWDKTPASHLSRKEPTTKTKYYLYVPSTYDAEKQYPLVITLHGTNPWDTRWHQIHEWRSLAEEKEFIVAAPNLRGYSTQGILPVSDEARLKDLKKDDTAILAVMDEICAEYNVDPKRVLLTGFSSGGFCMWYTGLMHSEKFSMLIARACNSDTSLMESMPLTLTDQSRRIPVALFVGKDDTFMQKMSWKAFEFLRRRGWTKHNSKMKKTDGGHLRQPQRAWRIWREQL